MVHLQPIPLFAAMGNIMGNASADRAQKIQQQGGGGDAIHVIIAENKNFFIGREGLDHAFGCAFDILDGAGRLNSAQGGGQKGLGRCNGGEAAIDQYGGHQGVNGQGGNQTLNICRVRFQNIPDHGHSRGL